MGKTDPIERARELRETLKKGDEVLVADFSGTLQGKDTSKVIDLMPNVATDEYVFRAKVNVKEIDPIAAATYGKDFFDVTKHSDDEIERVIQKAEFDFPLWFKDHPDFTMQKTVDYNPPFIMQVAGCNFHDGSEEGGCMYCFVDNVLNDGLVATGKTFLAPGDAIDSMVAASARVKEFYRTQANMDLDMKVFRVSGGEPTIALDWILNAWGEIAKRGLKYVGQIDSNLSTGPLVDEFERTGIYAPHTLERLAEHPIKILTALKGVNDKNLQENVQSKTTMATQLYSIKKFMNAGFDIFPQMYNPDPKCLDEYLTRMDGEIENFSSRVHIGPLKVYGPTEKRLTAYAKRMGIEDAEGFVEDTKKQWDSNYEGGCEVMHEYLEKNQGHGYKEVTRTDVPLKVLKK